MKKYKGIIYDIDGTILNTLDMNMYPLMKIIEEEMGEKWTYEEVLKFASYPGMKVMTELKVKNPETTYARWVKYVNDYPGGATTYPKMEEVLKKYREKGIPQGIVSAKTKKQYQIDVVEKGLGVYFSAVVLADDTKNHKPHPEPLEQCLKKMGLEKEEVIYIGDALSDSLASKNAGIDFGYAKWGNVLKEDLEAEHVFEEPGDLLRLLKEK